MQGEFKIKAGEFEGPLEVLLDLIERKKLHISSLSLAEITDDYIAYVNSHPNLPTAQVAQFVLIASTLILIKSVSLLPSLKLSEEESASIEDLERRLRMYAEARELALVLKERWGSEPSFFPARDRAFVPVFSPSSDLSLNKLLESFGEIIANLPKKAEKVPEAVMKKIISLEEVISNLTDRIQKTLSFKWSDLAKEHKEDKVGMIVSFLGILELVKQGIVDVTQNLHFAEIEIEKQKTLAPADGQSES